MIYILFLLEFQRIFYVDNYNMHLSIFKRATSKVRLNKECILMAKCYIKKIYCKIAKQDNYNCLQKVHNKIRLHKITDSMFAKDSFLRGHNNRIKHVNKHYIIE